MNVGVSLVANHVSREMPFAPKYCTSAVISALASKSSGSSSEARIVKSRMRPARNDPTDAPGATLSASGDTVKSEASARRGNTRNACVVGCAAPQNFTSMT